MNQIVFAVLMATVLNVCWSDVYDPKSYRMPKICKNQIYCNQAGAYYPYETVNKALKNEQVPKFGHLKDWCAGRTEDPATITECGIGQCGARIYYVNDLNNNTRVVLQSDLKGYEIKQLYDITRCETEGTPRDPRHLSKISLRKHKLTCKTIYAEFDFHVLKQDFIAVEYIRAKLPVCCKCRLLRK